MRVEGTYVAHCEPRRDISAVALRKYKGEGTYIALSKNMITPPIKKKPPGEQTKSALSFAPKHIGTNRTHRLSRRLPQSLYKHIISQWTTKLSRFSKHLSRRKAVRVRAQHISKWLQETYFENLTTTL